MTAKPWYKSLTFWGLIVTLLGLATAGIGRGTPLLDIFGDPAAQDIIGQLMLMLGMGAAVAGRARARAPVTLRRPKPPEEQNPDPREDKPPATQTTGCRVYERPELVPEGFEVKQYAPPSSGKARLYDCRKCEDCGETIITPGDL